MFDKIILDKFHGPIVLIGEHLYQMYTTHVAMCHAMYCKHSSISIHWDSSVDSNFWFYEKNMKCHKITCIRK